MMATMDWNALERQVRDAANGIRPKGMELVRRDYYNSPAIRREMPVVPLRETAVVRHHPNVEKRFTETIDIDGIRMKGMRINQRPPEDLWPEMHLIGYNYNELSYIVSSEWSDYEYLKSQEKGYVEGFCLHMVKFQDSSGIIFDMVPKVYQGIERERVLICADDRRVITSIIIPHPTAEDLADPAFLHQCSPLQRLRDSMENPTKNPAQINGNRIHQKLNGNVVHQKLNGGSKPKQLEAPTKQKAKSAYRPSFFEELGDFFFGV